MWLEQSIWIWAPAASAVLVWMVSRLLLLGREVRKLQGRIRQLEEAGSAAGVKNGARVRHAA